MCVMEFSRDTAHLMVVLRYDNSLSLISSLLVYEGQL